MRIVVRLITGCNGSDLPTLPHRAACAWLKCAWHHHDDAGEFFRVWNRSPARADNQVCNSLSMSGASTVAIILLILPCVVHDPIVPLN
ncbi:hypothetical protein C8R31_102512 [Nitrosospira sp. Nsp2]|nr:hypothetical protein C8R31_102512 [Nitrosospira sp. Nsp2]